MVKKLEKIFFVIADLIRNPLPITHLKRRLRVKPAMTGMQKIAFLKKTGFVLVFLFLCTAFKPLAAQENTVDTIKKDTSSFFVIVEVMPEFPGGVEARTKFINENIRLPKLLEQVDIEGRVFIGFVVEEDGSLTNFKVIRSVHPILDEEALRVAKLMPNWIPGKQRGKPVRVQYQIPINFIRQ